MEEVEPGRRDCEEDLELMREDHILSTLRVALKLRQVFLLFLARCLELRIAPY